MSQQRLDNVVILDMIQNPGSVVWIPIFWGMKTLWPAPCKAFSGTLH